MLIEQAIYQILKNDAGVIALVGNRIFYGVLDQIVNYPAIAYRPPAVGNRTLLRTLGGGCSLVSQRVHVYSASKGRGNSIAEQAAEPTTQLPAALISSSRAFIQKRGLAIDEHRLSSRSRSGCR